jgi:hypothetical protein
MTVFSTQPKVLGWAFVSDPFAELYIYLERKVSYVYYSCNCDQGNLAFLAGVEY